MGSTLQRHSFWEIFHNYGIKQFRAYHLETDVLELLNMPLTLCLLECVPHINRAMELSLDTRKLSLEIKGITRLFLNVRGKEKIF